MKTTVCSTSGIASYRVSAVVVVLILVLALAATGWGMLFSHFAIHDDEGYILMSAREYFVNGRLYDHVYTQYGPAYYFVLDVYQYGLGLIDHTSGRLITLWFWLGTAGCCAVLVRRETASLALSLFTFGATFLYLYFLPNEPMHPGGMIIFVLAFSTVGLVELIRRESWTGFSLIAGITASVLLLTKINVGVFYVASVGAWGILNATSAAIRRAAPFLSAIGLSLLAGALMRPLWSEPWIQTYVVLFGVGAITLSYAIQGQASFGARQVAIFALAALAAIIALAASVSLRGTSIAGLVDGILLRPLRHPSSYSYPVDWRPGALLFGIVSLALAGLDFHLRAKRSISAADRLVTALRWGQAAGLLLAIALLMHSRVIGAVFSYVAPLIWISVSPLSGAEPAGRSHTTRGLVAMILLLQFLHAYPVGGSQESWGTFLFVPLIILGLAELRPRLRKRAWSGVTAVLMAVLFGKVAWAGFEVQRTYASRIELKLPGAGTLRLPENLRSAYEILSVNAVVHADMLFSLPGMFSFNLWTALPAPTARNTTLWFTLLTENEQREIIASLDRAARPCIIVQESLVEMMRAERIPMQGPLVDYVHENFRCAFTVEGFAFLVRSGRHISPINIAQLTTPEVGIAFTTIGDGRSVSAIEVRDLIAPLGTVGQEIAPPLEITRVPVNTAGRPAGPPSTMKLPFEVKGLARLSFIGRLLEPPDRTATGIYLRGRDGNVVATVRFDETRF
jgi:hypothetical protein